MESLQIIEVIDSWNLTSRGIIAELRHYLDGLPSDLLLKSQASNKEWRVKNRVLFHHTLDKQKTFLSETITHTHGSFGSVENMLNSAKNILEREAQNIFQYQLQPIGHDSKPAEGDILVKAIS